MASPFPPTSQVPLHRNPPLAPSQELAYRKKCIDLRRRLREIQSHNETVQARIYRERAFHDKMRLNRAILMQHLQDVVDGGQLSADQIEALRATRTGGSLAEGMGYDSTMTGIDHHAQSQYLDDETELSGEEELPEVIVILLSLRLDASLNACSLCSPKNAPFAPNVPKTILAINQPLITKLPAVR